MKAVSTLTQRQIDTALYSRHDSPRLRVEFTATVSGATQRRMATGQTLPDLLIDQQLENGYGVVQASDVSFSVHDAAGSLEDWLRGADNGLVTVAIDAGFSHDNEDVQPRGHFEGRVKLGELRRDSDTGLLTVYAVSEVTRLGNFDASEVFSVGSGWTGQKDVKRILEGLETYLKPNSEPCDIDILPYESTSLSLNLWCDQPGTGFGQSRDICYLGQDSDYRYFVLAGCSFIDRNNKQAGVYWCRLSLPGNQYGLAPWVWSTEAIYVWHSPTFNNSRFHRISSTAVVLVNKHHDSNTVTTFHLLSLDNGLASIPVRYGYAVSGRTVNSEEIEPDFNQVSSIPNALVAIHPTGGGAVPRKIYMLQWSVAQLKAGTDPTATLADSAVSNMGATWAGAWGTCSMDTSVSGYYYYSVVGADFATPTLQVIATFRRDKSSNNWAFLYDHDPGYAWTTEEAAAASEYLVFTGQPQLFRVSTHVWLTPVTALDLASVKRLDYLEFERLPILSVIGVNMVAGGSTTYILTKITTDLSISTAFATDLTSTNSGKYEYAGSWKKQRRGTNYNGTEWVGAVNVVDGNGAPTDSRFRWISNKNVPVLDFGAGLSAGTRLKELLDACCVAGLGYLHFKSASSFRYVSRGVRLRDVPTIIGNHLIERGMRVEPAPWTRVTVANASSSYVEPAASKTGEPSLDSLSVTENLLPDDKLRPCAEMLHDWLQEFDGENAILPMSTYWLNLDGDTRPECGDYLEFDVMRTGASGTSLERVKAVVTGLQIAAATGELTVKLTAFRRRNP